MSHNDICLMVAMTAVSDALKERTLTEPAYVPLSPCPCDMTENSCDVNCCCDEVCVMIVAFGSSLMNLFIL